VDWYRWPESFESALISKETCHAIGLLVVTWNWCERMHKFLTGHYIGPPNAELIVASLPSNVRANLLADLVEAHEPRDDLREAIGYYQTCYAICLDNRNLLVHSLSAPVDFDQSKPMAFAAMAKRVGQENRFYSADPRVVLGVARECEFQFIYGTNLLQVARGQQTLRRRPPKPRKLTEVPQAQTVESPPRGSSQGKSKPRKK
jgi:hypothetical protein